MELDIESQAIVDSIEQGISDAIDVDTTAADWAVGALRQLRRDGYVITHPEPQCPERCVNGWHHCAPDIKGETYGMKSVRCKTCSEQPNQTQR